MVRLARGVMAGVLVVWCAWPAWAQAQDRRLPVSPRFSLDTTISLGRRSDMFRSRTEGLYVFLIRQRLRSATRGRFHVFLTYGLGGYYARVSQKAGQSMLPDGGFTSWPAFKYTEWEQPLATFVGGGVQHAIAPRLAVRAEVQMVSLVFLPMGVRMAGSVCIPLSRYVQ